ncbi:multiheme c-type cytochrome [Glacieibacterium frigidum]|uniref:Cytochrome c-552/4 domain-containing protein n=1 Tax=Glacieibacterium frigidum TaxID=2593303 RepID=A0A552U9G8_9SPHN|nr:multiheme c-type cytochrome [Glacieibacterium frigidum]TRW14855.1 hypothetical protein FMM06_14365 [Glacieibacterium frigidum]
MAGRGFIGLIAAALALSGSAAAVDRHEGVATCSGSTCHGRQLATGKTVRQNELLTWQDETSIAGVHSRAWRVLLQPRAKAIAARLNIGAPETAAECVSCHGDATPHRGARFRMDDGVGCEVCHGGSTRWVASHIRVGVSHADNVRAGMTPVNDVRTRAGVCLDCHFGSSKPGQFVTHRVMAAGHPRVAFELDLFTALQRHHDEDADYVQRKGRAGGVKTWAVGQALALERALTLFQGRGMAGSFPEFYFFDCRSCHRTFSDDPAAKLAIRNNPARPFMLGNVVFNDENLIMLGAAARAVDPALAARLDVQAKAFHAALGQDRAGALKATAALAATARALAARFAASSFSRAQTLAMLRDVTSGAAAAAATDYQGGVQAVMAAETLLAAMVADGQVGQAQARAARPDIDRAYAAVRDANAYRANDFRAAMARVGGVGR